MKKLPDAELELMMIIWEAEEPVTRLYIEEHMDEGRDVLPNTVLTLLSRLERRGFVRKDRQGKMNYYSAVVPKEPYLKAAGRGVLQRMFHGSLRNFAAALYEGEEIDPEEAEALYRFLEEKRQERG